MPRGEFIGDIRITGSELREGILYGETWPLIFEQNNETWKRLGGCELSGGTSKDCVNPTFNYFPTSKDAVIEWSEEQESSAKNVAASKAEGAAIDVARMPYLNHPATFERPTLLAFEITGHVMLGIVYNRKAGRGPEIHILNPWALSSDKASTSDVYALLATSLKKASRNVIIVDVVDELEKKYKTEINLQEFERKGFCTLWVGILAKGAIPRITELQNSVTASRSIVGAGQQLNDATLAIYQQIYSSIKLDWARAMLETVKDFGEDRCVPTLSAAKAALRLAQKAQTGSKRKSKRQTRRKRLYKSKWTKKHRSLQLM